VRPEIVACVARDRINQVQVRERVTDSTNKDKIYEDQGVIIVSAKIANGLYSMRKCRPVEVLTGFEDNEVPGQLVVDLLETFRIKVQE